MRDWERRRRRFDTWTSLVTLRFRQDALDAERRRKAALAGELEVVVAPYDTAIKRALLTGPSRTALERVLGPHAFARWENDLGAFADVVAGDLVREHELADAYTALIAGARTAFRGGQASAGDLARFAEDPDRDTRREAAFASFAIFEANAGALDAIFDDLVRTRASIARDLGYVDFGDLAYRRRGRTDYGPSDVAAFREDVRTSIVPLAEEIAREQAEALGVDALMPWDAAVFDRGGRIAMPDSPDDLLARVVDALGALSPEIGAFAARNAAAGLYDVHDRPGKAPGAFCTVFASSGTPFVFAKLSGTSADVGTLAHETGHALQMARSAHQPVLEYVVPTAETGEICSMALEFLLWPQYERVLGADAARFRARHLRTQLMMLPYIAAVDEFQDRVYATPGAAPAERNAMWLEMERRYMPWLNDGGIPHLARGGRWQRQRHIYAFPFYYIDYGLAMCCALQLWTESLGDPTSALERYLALCAIGGELPFRALTERAGLRSPFAPGTLATVADAARSELRATS